MNYNSINEILSAGTTNMTVIRNNTKSDDDTDTITGVSWFKFNGVVTSNIYASGNSWIGFGSSSEHLKVNRRDGAVYSIYREEGTLYNYYKFLKIRWDGYSRYNQTSSSYKVTYDVILWDTGDISLHMINIPTSYNTGTYSLVAGSTYSYTVSTSSPDVTFTKTNSGFTVSNSLIALELPYEKRYLIRSGTTYYTVVNNSLSEITVNTLTSTVFLENGVNEIPDVNLLYSLENPELLYWTENDEGLKQGLILTGTPTLPQIVYFNNYTLTSSIKELITVCSSDVLFTITTDGGNTWKYFDGSNWVVSTSASNGMTYEVIENMSSTMWSKLITSGTIKIRCALPNLSSYISNTICINK